MSNWDVGFGVFLGIVGIFSVYFSRYTQTDCVTQNFAGACIQYETIRPYYLFEPIGYALIFTGVILAIVGAVRSSR